MDAQETHVAPHDVRSSEGLPGPTRRGIRSLGEGDRCKQPRSASGTRVQHTFVLFPVGTIDHGTAKHHCWIGEAQVSYEAILTRVNENGKERGQNGSSPPMPDRTP